jgi:tetratricopeptide (TPR) repeat protein
MKKSEVKSQGSEDGGRGSEVGDQRSEVGSSCDLIPGDSSFKAIRRVLLVLAVALITSAWVPGSLGNPLQIKRVLIASPRADDVDPGFSPQEMDTHMHGGAGKVGSVVFPVSCRPVSRRQFGVAVAMLHSFWYEESGSAFAAIAQNDPSCAMAYWGQAMSLYHPLWEQPSAQTLAEGRAALLRAKAFGNKTPRERDYILALDAFFADEKRDYVTRALDYEKAMDQLRQSYPRDEEAVVFYALALVGSAQALPADKTYAREKKAAAILNRVLVHQPKHPGVAHYLIHAYDSPPLANLALQAARSYARIAPAVPHALHMPSHIFTRLGLWQESIKSNLDSEAAARDYSAKMHLPGAWDQQLHAMDYLMYAHLQLADDEKAKAVLDELNRITKVTPESVAPAYAFAAVPARFAIERRQWAEAASLEIRPESFPWDRYPWARAILSFARGIGAARIGNAVAARNEALTLATIEKDFANSRGYNWAGQVEVQRQAVSAWAAHAEGKNDEAIQLMRAAADLEDASDKHPVTPGPIIPARELLGELLLELGRNSEALKEFETSLAVAPKRFNGLYGAAHAAELSQDREKAGAYYQELVALAGGSNSKRIELEQAKAYLKKTTSAAK